MSRDERPLNRGYINCKSYAITAASRRTPVNKNSSLVIPGQPRRAEPGMTRSLAGDSGFAQMRAPE
jgi:hypothetical protein